MPLPAQIKIPKQRGSEGPVWEGPSGKGPNGGVTQSLISRYLACKERFRILVMEGLKPREGFNHRLEFGNMWHICEEWEGAEGPTQGVDFSVPLLNYCRGLCEKYRTDTEQINHWYNVCKALWPVYQEYWTEVNPDRNKRTPLLREERFDVEYVLPSGRSVRLRGKWDGVDLVESESGKWIELNENKTKSQIDSEKINRQLTFDLQTMMYLITLTEWLNDICQDDPGMAEQFSAQIVGVRYNVVRRAAHKSVDSMMKKVAEDYKNGRIGEWFARWDVPVYDTDYETFKTQCLNPILENMLDDYEWWQYIMYEYDGQNEAHGERADIFNWKLRHYSTFPKHCERHFRTPYGIYNPIADGGFGDVDEYMKTGSEVGLERVTNLFPELEV